MKIEKKSKQLISLFTKNKILILYSLYQCPDQLCGCDLVEKLKIPKNLLSYHIRSLENAGMVAETKCGKNKKYRVTDKNKVKNILSILEII